MLVKRYPFLKPSLGYGIDMHYYPKGYKYRYEETWLDCLPSGWRKVFGLQICEDLRNAIKKSNITNYAIEQVKEKFGTLCWYDENGNDEIRAITLKYSELTYRICQICGSPAEYVSKRWISYYCGKCVDKYHIEDVENIKSAKQ